MPTFIMTGTWTEQGIRAVKEAPKRAQAARDLAKKLGVEIKQVFLTSGESDLLLILETPNGDNIPKFAMAIGLTVRPSPLGSGGNFACGSR